MPLNRLPRRIFLRAAGVCIGLPMLDAMLPRIGRAELAATNVPPMRMVLISRALGLHAPYFFPEQSGRDYQPSRYLKLLESHRHEFTVFSGMSHHYGSGHGTLAGLFTGVAPERMRQGAIRNTISLDQEVAARLNSPTRHAFLALGSSGLSWNHKGVLIPSQGRVLDVFKQLFIDGTPEEVAKQVERIRRGQSILDGVREQSKSLAGNLGKSDRDRIDVLLASIREAEKRLQQDQEWVRKAKPKVNGDLFAKSFGATQLIEREHQWLELVRLALDTDSTRVITLHLQSHGNVSIDGKLIAHHESSHHGRNEDTIERLAMIEEAQLKSFDAFLGRMKATKEGSASLLDRTQVLYASDLGNASAHTTSNLPILLAGGGFKHAGHVAFDRKNNKLMSNLFVRMLRQMDIDVDRFGNSNGTLSEI
ncbi:MAG: DUF1552 domain-containing protein [Gemmataceae bacterium]